ncbi:MAG: S41 family peptidase [Bacteroidales bacterium]
MSKRRNSQSVLTILIIFLLGALSHSIYVKVTQNREIAIKGAGWEKLLLVLDQIDRHYVDSVDKRGVSESLIPYLLQSLDPHSIYLPPSELKISDEQLVGNFDGIGIQFNSPNDTAVVINVIGGGPSDKVGILSGDRIVKVDQKRVAGVEFQQDSLVSLLRGKSGTKVSLEIMRVGLKEPLTFEITRGKIPLKSVDVAFMLNDSLGYIKLTKFTRTSHKEFLTAMEHLTQEGLSSLIIDLRGNSGGYFDQALLISNEFLEKKSLLVFTEGRKRSRQNYFADGRGKYFDVELKVLIDEGSASSSEILAGAIQDNDRGVIIGRRSFGKSLVQEPIYFSDSSGIRLTVARFYTPSGRSIQKPYRSDNYREDIIERYRHGEMLSADSIKIDSSQIYRTPAGKTLYGGGGIVPDLFIPIDTVGATPFLIKISNLGLTFRYSAKLADRYRGELNRITNLEMLYSLFDKINLEEGFLEYLKKLGITPTPKEWNSSREVALAHIKAFTGRYSPLEDGAFYPILLSIDRTILTITAPSEQ